MDNIIYVTVIDKYRTRLVKTHMDYIIYMEQSQTQSDTVKIQNDRSTIPILTLKTLFQ